MENTNSSDIKTRTSKKHLIYFINQLDESYNDKIPYELWGITNNINEAHLFIHSSTNEFTFKYKINNKYKNHNVRKENFLVTLSHLHSTFENFTPAPKVQTKNIYSLKKNKEAWCDFHFLLEETKKIYLDSSDIMDFSQKLLEISSLNSFTTIHLFLHEKGNINSNHFQINKTDYSQSPQKISEFTNLYQAIKKSKNRSFGQSTLKASNFKIIGTCLAHEFSLKNHNLIFLISKDDFIPQDEKDIIFFKQLIPLLEFYFDLILSKNLNKKKIKLNKLLFKILNIYIDDTNSMKFTDNNTDFFIQDFEAIFETIQKRSFNIVDVNHQERIMLLGELLNTLKHELSNPLFGLQLTSELLLLDQTNEDEKEFLEQICLAIKRCQNIINNFSEIYKETPEFEDVDIINLIKEVITLTKSESKSIPKEILLNGTSIIPFKTKLILKTNQTWLAQVFFNLIINSAQALNSMKKENPLIRIQVVEKQGFIEIDLSDNGPGLSEKIAKDIFTPFFTTKEKGTGLGLSISKSLIKKLKGDVTYIPSDNGASFLIRLPYENVNH